MSKIVKSGFRYRNSPVFGMPPVYRRYTSIFETMDFMVVCRLRKNTDFRLNESTNRASSSQRPISAVQDSNCASEAGTEQGEKVAECSSKKCSSSYDSYSIEQNDSASESNQKLAVEVTQPECSGHQKGYEDEDDCFAEILKDDIIKLDEPSISGALDISPLPTIVPGEEQKSQQPPEADVPQGFPSQGTANRRIRLKMETERMNPTRAIQIAKSAKQGLFTRRNKSLNSEAKLPKCSTCASSSSSSARISVRCYHVIVVITLLASTALFVSSLGGFWRVRSIIFQSLYQDYLC